jgi:hypothetical protein
VIPASGPFASLLFPCNLLSSPALGRSSINSPRHSDFQQRIGSVVPAFCAKSPCSGLGNRNDDAFGVLRYLMLVAHGRPLEPPYTDPYVRWCGRGGAARLPPIPIFGPSRRFRRSAVRRSAATFFLCFRYATKKSDHRLDHGRGPIFLRPPRAPCGPQRPACASRRGSVAWEAGLGRLDGGNVVPSNWAGPQPQPRAKRSGAIASPAGLQLTAWPPMIPAWHPEISPPPGPWLKSRADFESRTPPASGSHNFIGGMTQPRGIRPTCSQRSRRSVWPRNSRSCPSC